MSHLEVDVGTVELVADWVETSLLVNQSGTLTLDRLYSLAQEEIDVSPQTTALAVNVMEKRTALGDLYPFSVIQGLAVQRRRDTPLLNAYATLLFLTPGSIPRQALTDLTVPSMGALLEDISERALANLWGAGGMALSFGFPSRYGRPQEFNEAVEWLARKIGVEPGRGYRPPRRKDGGVDIVAWRQFLDKRPGFPIALAQCTIQAEAFTKTTDIDTRLWSTWLAMDIDPISLLVIPGTVRRQGPEWRQLTSVVTVIERLRLVELLGRATDAVPEFDWTETVVARLRNRLTASEV